ncbi:hypothetical protein Tco_0033304 [Tanacetum coccineum]
MLNKKLQADYWNEMWYQLLKLMIQKMNIKFRGGLLGLKDFKMILKVTTAQDNRQCSTGFIHIKDTLDNIVRRPPLTTPLRLYTISYLFVSIAFTTNEDTTAEVQKRKNKYPPLFARAEEALSSGTVNTYWKRKNTSPLLAIRPEDALFTRNIRSRYTAATSNTRHANTNRNSPSINIQNLSSNATHGRRSKIDRSINKGQGPYVFKISGQIYHWIGSLCPEEGHHPCFLYVYDTCDELSNRMHHFGGLDEGTLNPEIVEGLIHVLDEHNGLVRLFRTARDRCNAVEIPSFKIRLYNMGGVHGYELLTVDVLGAIVFENRPRIRIDFDSRLDFIHRKQNDLRSNFLLGLYDAVSRGDREGIAAGSKIMLPILYTIEFQNIGLPHCHTLLWVDSKSTLKDTPQIDKYIYAEIPDPVQDPIRYKLVMELMMHGPCGAANLSAPCNKHFPKQYNEKTYFDSNGHTQYQRRDTGIHVMMGESKLDNCNVVPYNRALCPAFEAHINVEYCGWSMLIKYLFKYISKGPDRILAKISNSEASTLAVGTTTQIDEIQNYVDGCFICPYEACSRIFDFSIHCREPAVQILNVHLEDMQRINFRERDRLDIIVNMPEKKKTTLTEWFVYNNENIDGRHLKYLNFPSKFVWYPNSKQWQRRYIRTKKSLERLTYVHPSSGDLFYFRMLLCHQKGCKSPNEVRIVNGQTLPTFRAACEALGLLGDDKECDIALQESIALAT